MSCIQKGYLSYIKVILLSGCMASLVFIFNACEQSFDPLLDNDRYHYSVYGFLDASADTQWIRVMPVRDSILTSPEPQQITVSITRKSTGKKVTLNDSLFSLRNNMYVWNYWTTEDIHFGEEYGFEVVSDNGDKSSSATVQVPDDYPTPVVNYIDGAATGRMYVEQVERIVAVEIKYYFRVNSSRTGLSDLYSHSYSQIDEVREQGNNKYDVALLVGMNKGEITEFYADQNSFIEHERQEILIVSGGPDWPDVEGLLEEEKVLPDAVSNVNNGLGIVAGIVSKRLPLKSCYNENGDRIGCPLIEN